MRLKDFIAMMERIAPPELAMGFDNPGLIVGPEREEITRVLVALDCTPAVAGEAVAEGCQLVLTHHPLFLQAQKRILPDAPETAAAYRLIRHGIGLYAAHTNLDAAQGGVNDCLAQCLGLREVAPLPPEGLGRVGMLRRPMLLTQLAGQVERALNTRVHLCGEDRMVTRVAVVGGAGGGEAPAASRAGAEVLITGEAKHHHALEAGILGIALMAAGHYETERVVLQPLIFRLQQADSTVQYKLTRVEEPVFWRLSGAE